MTTTRTTPGSAADLASAGRTTAPVSNEQQIAAAANRLQMSIRLTKADGSEATLTGRDLVTLMARPNGLEALHNEYGVDPRDFFSAVGTSVENNQVEVDLRQSEATEAIYNQNDSDFVRSPRSDVTDNEARVQTGLVDGFRVSGDAVDAPELSFWDRLVDVLAEIFTLGFAETRTFDGAIDAERWQHNAASIAMAGGSALRTELNTLSQEAAQSRLKEIISQANPDISDAQSTSISRSLEQGLRAIYEHPAIKEAGGGDQEINARLDSLRRSFVTGDLGQDPGQWLHRTLQRSPAELLGALNEANSPAETEVMLTLGMPAFANLDAPSQAHLARLTFDSKQVEGAAAALQGLAQNEAFLQLPASSRRLLLNALEQSGCEPQRVDGMARVAENFSGLPAALISKASESLEGSANNAANLEAMQAILGTSCFRELDEDLAIYALGRLESVGYDAAAVDGISQLLTAQQAGNPIDAEAMRALLDGMVGARTTQERNGLVNLTLAPGFQGAAPEVQGAMVGALRGASSQSRRENVMALINSQGFKAQSSESQAALLSRFESGNQAVQDGFAQVITALDATVDTESGALAVEQAVANWVVSRFTQSGGASLSDKAAGLATILPSLHDSQLDSAGQTEVLSVLQERGFTSADAEVLGQVAADRSFARVSSGVRSSILNKIGGARNQASVAMWSGLARDNDLARLSPDNQRTMVEIGTRRGAQFLREVRYLTGAKEFREPGNGVLGPAQRNQHQGALLSLIGRDSPELSLNDVQGMRTMIRESDFATLSSAHQEEVLELVADDSQRGPLLSSMLGNYGSVPVAERQGYIDTMVTVTNQTQANDFNAITGASSFASASPALRQRIFDGIMQEGAEFSGRLAPLMSTLGNSPVDQELAVDTALLQARGVSNPALQSNVNQILGEASFLSLPKEMKRDILRQLTADPALAPSYAALFADSNFSGLSADTREAIAAQSVHYPNRTAIDNLTRLSGASWLGGMSLADQQRSAKLIGYVSTHRHNATNPQQQAILENTVSQFLPPGGTFRLNFKTYSNPPGTVTYGSAYGGVFHLNQALIPAGNGAVPNTGSARHLAQHTMAHEVNHLMNVDLVRNTHDYFMGEYGAWYVGFVAEHGRPPNRQESYNRARYLLTRTTGAYDSIRQARVDTEREYWIFGDEVPADEAERIISFMGQFFTPTPSPTDPASANVIVQSGYTPPNPSGVGPAPDVVRNMTNGGTPPAGGSGHDHQGHDHHHH